MKSIAKFILFVILLVITSSIALCENDDWPETQLPLKSGDYTYKVLDDGTAKITDYSGHADTVSIPKTISNYRVTSIILDVFCSAKVVKIHKDISDIEISNSGLYRANSINQSYSVSSDNPYYKTIDGVLFNKSGDTLLSYPVCKKGKKYKVPSEVKVIGDYSFMLALNLREIQLPNTLEEIGSSAFYRTNIEFIEIPKSVKKMYWSTFSECLDLILIVDRDSYAESFVKKQKIKYIYSAKPNNNEEKEKNGSKIVRVIKDANVRKSYSQDSEKVGRVHSNEEYVLLNTSNNNWYKIQLEDGTVGWISGKLAEIIEFEETSEKRAEQTFESTKTITENIPAIDRQYFVRAVIVAATNSQATDVYKADRMTIDKKLLHHYADTSGYFLLMESEGEWSDISNNVWRVEEMILKIPEYNTYMSVWCNVSYSNNEFKITNMKKTISSTKNFDDPNKTTVIKESDDEVYMTVPFSFVEEDRANASFESKSTGSSYEEKKHKDWVGSQFSIWDGSHKQFNKLIAKNLNDEKSFKHIETDYIEITDESVKNWINSVLKDSGYKQTIDIGDLLIITEFSAKNAFNATIKAKAYGISRYSNNSLILLGIE